jgi:hypothetical protein
MSSTATRASVYAAPWATHLLVTAAPAAQRERAGVELFLIDAKDPRHHPP